MKMKATRIPPNRDGLYWLSARVAIRLENVRRVFKNRMLLDGNEYIDLTNRELFSLRRAMACRRPGKSTPEWAVERAKRFVETALGARVKNGGEA